jgi:hypothetical protein
MMVVAMQERVWSNNEFGSVISARSLELVFESMIRDAVARQKKGGIGSRSPVTSAMSGFLRVLTHHIAGPAVQS